jgi:hypothetical protein
VQQPLSDAHRNGYGTTDSPGEGLAQREKLLFGAQLLRWSKHGTCRELGELCFEAPHPIHQLQLALEREHPVVRLESRLWPRPCSVNRLGHGARFSLFLLTGQLYRPGVRAIGCRR